MKEKQKNFKEGFTFLELVIVIAVCLILAGISIAGMSRISNKSTLDADSSIVKSAILKARSMSVNGVGGTEHGIFFASTTVTIFQGTNFLNAQKDAVYNLSKSNISSVVLTNATTSFYFSKMTGNPSATGHLILSDGEATTSIVIYASGLSE